MAAAIEHAAEPVESREVQVRVSESQYAYRRGLSRALRVYELALIFVGGGTLAFSIYKTLSTPTLQVADGVAAAVVTVGGGVLLYAIGKFHDWRKERLESHRRARKQAWQFALLEGASRHPGGLDLLVLREGVPDYDREIVNEAAMELIQSQQLVLESGRIFYKHPPSRQLTSVPIPTDDSKAG